MAIFLSSSEQAFISAHLTTDVRALVLRGQPGELDIKKVAAQIVARQKAREKLPTWYANDRLIFPPALSVEQASSERTAQYKASLISGRLLLDLTGGMGVDTWAFAQRVDRVMYVERNPELAALAAHNLPLLGTRNVVVQSGDGLALLNDSPENKTAFEIANWIYLDPHRRNELGGKMVRLEDCEPDVSRPSMVAALLKKAQHILLKASPLLDIDKAVQQLQGAVNSVHVVAVQGEVKEILFVLANQPTVKETISFNAVNIVADRTISLRFQWGDEREAEVNFGDPEQYVYEPNAAVLKTGAFRLVAARFGLTKLAPNSHLYTSSLLRTDFPGRIFSLQAVIRPDSKTLKTILPTMKANLTIRNFPQSVADLRKKLNLNEGGDVYILATTLLNGDKRLLITKKVDNPV
ncbi:THUMP-like domain-containing protein [Spirosoma jeollabukense]